MFHLLEISFLPFAVFLQIFYLFVTDGYPTKNRKNSKLKKKTGLKIKPVFLILQVFPQVSYFFAYIYLSHK